MPVADIRAGEDDLGDVAPSLGKNPAGSDLNEGLKGRSGKDRCKVE
jgi:hypothetical protein